MMWNEQGAEILEFTPKQPLTDLERWNLRFEMQAMVERMYPDLTPAQAFHHFWIQAMYNDTETYPLLDPPDVARRALKDLTEIVMALK